MGDGGMLIGQCRYPPSTLFRWMKVKADLQSISSGTSLRVVYYEVLSEDRPKRENFSVISFNASHSLCSQPMTGIETCSIVRSKVPIWTHPPLLGLVGEEYLVGSQCPQNVVMIELPLFHPSLLIHLSSPFLHSSTSPSSQSIQQLHSIAHQT